MGVHLFDVCMHAYVCVGKGLLGGTWVFFLRHEQNIRILGPYFLLVFFSARGTTHPPLTPPPFPLFLTTFTSSPGNFLRSRLSHFWRAQRFLMTSICFLQRSFYS